MNYSPKTQELGYQLLALRSYIEVSTTLTQQQIGFLEVSRPLMQAAIAEALEQDIEDMINENLEVVSAAVQDLDAQDYYRLCVRNPEDQTIAILNGIGYNAAMGGYTALVNGGEELWPLIDSRQLVLGALQTSPIFQQ